MYIWEITLIVKTDSSPLIEHTKCSFCCHLRKKLVKTKRTAKFHEHM